MAVAQNWRDFRRTGTVTARQRFENWSWTVESGENMSAQSGDWEVTEPDGRTHSVRDDAFRASYTLVDGNHWRRSGVVQARPAVNGETIESLEGDTTAATGDWVVKGTQGEQWIVPGDTFAQRYEAANPTGDS